MIYKNDKIIINELVFCIACSEMNNSLVCRMIDEEEIDIKELMRKKDILNMICEKRNEIIAIKILEKMNITKENIVKYEYKALISAIKYNMKLLQKN